MSHKKSLEEKLEKTENVLRENLNTVRAGRANPALLPIRQDRGAVPSKWQKRTLTAAGFET